jgi:PAS domain S-box-containing protein
MAWRDWCFVAVENCTTAHRFPAENSETFPCRWLTCAWSDVRQSRDQWSTFAHEDICYPLRVFHQTFASPFFFVYLAAILIAGWCGYGPGVMGVFFISFVSPYLIRPGFSFAQISWASVLPFLMLSLLVSHTSAVARKGENTLRALNDELERRVQNRTAELAAAQAELTLVTENMAAAVTRCSRDFRYVWVSPAYAAWLNRERKAIEGRPIRDVIGADGFEEIRPYMERVIAGEKVEYTARVHFFGMSERWINAVYIPVRRPDDVVDGWIAVVTDITERVKQE